MSNINYQKTKELSSRSTLLASLTTPTIVFLVIALLMVFVVIFLRFYRIPEYLMFLSDQGRDAIILKRLVTLEKLVFVGPTTSIGNVFTGPFYYYLVAPFMWLFRLDPVGPAYAIALINSLGLVGVFGYVWRRYGKVTSLLFLTLVGLASTQIFQSRYSWNPNPVPLFTMLTLIAWQKTLETKKVRYFILSGLLFGFCLQLHYITIIILAPVVFSVFVKIIKTVRNHQLQIGTARLLPTIFRSVPPTHYVLLFVSCILSFTPIILFEIKNNFINTYAFVRAFSTSEVQAKTTFFIDRLRDSCAGFINHLLLIKITGDQALIVLTIFFIVALIFVWKQKRRNSYFIVWCVVLVITNIFALSRLEVGRHVHYFNPSYWPMYLTIAYVGNSILHIFSNRIYKGIIIIVLLIILGLYVKTQITSLYFLTDKPRIYTQVRQAKVVAQYIISQQTSDQYQVVGLPFFETEGHYRYYLEYLKHKPMSADSLGDPKELFVICHELAKKDCDIPGNPQWQLADFQNKHQNWKIESTKLIEEVRVFKLVY